MKPCQRLLLAILIFAAIIAVGTFGYSRIEGWSLFESLYMTFIMITTVGLSTQMPVSPTGKVFTMFLLVGGISTAAYAVGVITETLVQGYLQNLLGRRKMQKKVDQLTGHYIVCGHGRMGSVVCEVFAKRNITFVVIDKNEDQVMAAEQLGYLVVKGDATSDETLKHAHVERAKGLISLASSDADNVFITLSAKQLNPKLFLLTRAEDDASERKLKRAGADRVVLPYKFGGMRIALSVLQPRVTDVMDFFAGTEDATFAVEEIEVGSGGPTGETLGGLRLREQYGVTVVAVRGSSGQMTYFPPADTTIQEGDILIALGRPADVARFHAFLLAS